MTDPAMSPRSRHRGGAMTSLEEVEFTGEDINIAVSNGTISIPEAGRT